MKRSICAILMIIALSAMANYEEPRDYTNLTVLDAPYPDIAVDVKKEYHDGYIRLLWQLNKGE